MNLQRIEHLLSRYELGETSVQEEQELKNFFEQEEVPYHLAAYKDLFVFYGEAAAEELPDPGFDEKVLSAMRETDLSQETKHRYRRLYPVVGIAAGFVLLFGLYFMFQGKSATQDTFEDPEIAYAETKKILMKVSGNLNTGIGELENIKEIDNGMNNLENIKTFDEGMKNMRKISVLDKSKDIITQKTNTQ